VPLFFCSPYKGISRAAIFFFFPFSIALFPLSPLKPKLPPAEKFAHYPFLMELELEILVGFSLFPPLPGFFPSPLFFLSFNNNKWLCGRRLSCPPAVLPLLFFLPRQKKYQLHPRDGKGALSFFPSFWLVSSVAFFFLPRLSPRKKK